MRSGVRHPPDPVDARRQVLPLRVLALFLAVSVAAAAGEDSPIMSGFMRPGMVLKEFYYQINSADGGGSQMLAARRAEILDPSHLMGIDGLSVRGGTGSRSYSFTAAEAVYDFKTSSLHTPGAFQGSALGMRFSGSRLRGEVRSRIFDMSGDFQIHLDALVRAAPRAPDVTWEQLTGGPTPPLDPRGHVAAREMTPMGLIQDFAGDLMTFLHCWSRVAEDGSGEQTGSQRAPELMILGREGGRIDLRLLEMNLKGRAAILAPGSFLSSQGGIRIGEAMVELDRMMRLTGSGGIQVWMTPSGSGKTLIRSDRFEFVSDRRILQFEGGPLTVSRRGIILQASENWQFVRVFDGGRVVLSPGNWTTVGSLATSGE
ncbi:MAG: hypothetical protein V4689_03980 [Verrucomicrobiota bacterium]